MWRSGLIMIIVTTVKLCGIHMQNSYINIFLSGLHRQGPDYTHLHNIFCVILDLLLLHWKKGTLTYPNLHSIETPVLPFKHQYNCCERIQEQEQ